MMIRLIMRSTGNNRYIAFLVTAFLVVAAMNVIADTATEDNSVADKLLQLAQKQSISLAPSEEKLFRAAANGKTANYRIDSENDNDPANAAAWLSVHVIRADRLVWLCTDPEASKLVTYRGILVNGARIDGVTSLLSVILSVRSSDGHKCLRLKLMLPMPL
jgi:hypothetical protein